MAISNEDINAIKAALGPGGTNPLTDVQRGVTPTQTSTNNGYSAARPATQTPIGVGSTLSPAVITGKPAAQDLSNITTAYQNIKQGVANQSSQNQAITAANNAVPTIPGYNVSANPNSGQGVIQVKSNTTGQTYYASPLTPPAPKAPSASDIAGQFSNYGVTPDDVTAFQQANPGLEYTQQDAQQSLRGTQAYNNDQAEANANAQYQSGTSQISGEQQNAYNDFKAKVDQLTSGTFPLTGAQQALIDSTKASFDQAAEQANLKGAALSSQTGGFSNKVSATLGEINSIDAQKAGVLANLEMGFQTQDYNLIKDAYNAFTDLETKKTATIEKLHNDAIDHVKEVRQVAKDEQAREDTLAQNEITNNLNSDRFSWQQKNDMAQNAIQQGQLDLDTWYKQQDTALKQADQNLKGAQFNAEYGAFVSADGTPVTGVKPDDIPGVTKTTQGITYFDPSSITDTNIKKAAEAQARKLGIPALDTDQGKAMTSFTQALSQIDLLEAQAKKIAPSNFVGAKTLDIGANAVSALANDTGIYTTQNKIDRDTYNSNRLGLIKILSSINPSARGVSGQLLEQAEASIPVFGTFSEDNAPGAASKFQSLRQNIYGNIKGIIPNAPVPSDGSQMHDGITLPGDPNAPKSTGSSYNGITLPN